MHRYTSGYPKVDSIESVDKCLLDKFLVDSLNSTEKVSLEVVDDQISVEDITRNYIQSHDFVGTYYFIDCSMILDQYKQWFHTFKDVQPYYAVKCNPEPAIVHLMSTFPNMCYDCASPYEISAVLKTGLGQDRVIYANPIKSADGIRFMQKNSVLTSTIDCVEEIEKMYMLLGDSFSEYNLVIRLWVDDSHSSVPLGSKFGAHISEIPAIMAAIKEYNGRYIGVSFHVGSGCSDGYAYDNAIHTAAQVDKIAREYGYITTFLDLGGGWSGYLGTDHNTELQERADIVHAAVKKYGLEGVEVVAEPGRYFVDRTVHMCVTIERTIINKDIMNEVKEIEGSHILPTFRIDAPIAPKYSIHEKNERYKIKKDIIYQLNEGYEGGFKDRFLCDYIYGAEPLFININKNLKRNQEEEEKKKVYNCLLVGPSEHKQEIVNYNAPLPLLPNGDWLLFKNMGAYTMSLCTKQVREGQRRVFYIRRQDLTDEAYEYYCKCKQL
ncbi:hypothetical protein WA158_002694 [Blastocystis sp. Blastoise]